MQISFPLRNILQWLLIFLLVVGITACGFWKNSTKVEPLPPVAPLVTPQLPPWIEQITPTGNAEPLAQILIRFKDPLIPLESLDSTAQQDKLKFFEIVPPLPGNFRFLTPKMVGFQATQALPKATRVQVTLKAGLEDLKNHRLTQDLAWTFNTEPIQLTNLPQIETTEYTEPQPVDLKPTLQITSNVELSLDTLKKYTQLIPDGQSKSVPLKIELANSETDSTNPDSPQVQFNPALNEKIYQITPTKNLEKATLYRLEFSAGLEPVRGNLPTEKEFLGEIKTYAPLQFEKIKFFGQPDAGGAYGRFVKGSPQLLFNNGILAESALENITINPPPKPEPTLVQAYDNERLVNLNPWALEPNTNYTITIGENLTDQFGQTLGQPITVDYQTGDIAAELWTPDGLNIFPAGKDLELNITAVNLPESGYKAAYRVVQPTDLVYADSAYPRETGNLLSNPDTWESFPIQGEKNQTTTITVPLRERLGSPTGLLAYGVQARTNSYPENNQQKWRKPTYYGMVQLTNLGVFAQWFPDSGLIRVHHLADGSAVQNATIEIYESQLEAPSTPTPRPCATGRTDRNGTLQLNNQNFRQCLNSTEESAPELLVIARENQDWAFARTQRYTGAYGYGIYADWQSGKPITRGTIFSDRQLYQPSEIAWFTGAAYYLEQGTLKQDKNASYQVTLQNPDGSESDLGTQTTNEFGTFSFEWPLSSRQPLGYYQLRAKNEKGIEISGEFRVAEFKPPNFKVDLSLDKPFALMNEKVEASAASNYLFGAPLEGGKATYYVTRSRTEFTPKGWEKFAFGRQWFWPEESPTVSSDVLQKNSVLDDNGQGKQTVTVAKDLPYPMQYRVDVEVADVSNLSVANSQSFIALPSNKLIGLQSNFVADAGKKFPVEVIVTDPSGNAIAGERIRVELQKITYNSVTRVVEGSRQPQNQVEYQTVATEEVRSRKTPQSVSLVPPESGSYRIRANFANAKDEITATDGQIWVTGNQAVRWGRRDRDNYLQIKLDKETYQPGEIATALIQSPYPEAELYFAVVRDKPLYQHTEKVRGGAPQIRFKVTEAMLPNAAVQAVLVRQGAPLEQVETGSLENLVQIGFAPFDTNLTEKYLTVSVTPVQTENQPAAQETIDLELKDHQGRPVRGQFTVMVVNEAVLQLSGYRPPDLVETVYAKQGISTRFSDNRFEVVLAPLASPLQKGWGYGGGFSAGAENTRVRRDFQPLAYFNGSVVSDRNGKARISFNLPDDLTTWRAIAVATTGDLRFGNGENTFITTKPLLSNPILPQFARPGDRISAGLAVTNTTGRKGNLTINGTLSSSALTPDGQLPVIFAQDNRPNQGLRTKAETGTQAYRFPMLVNNAGDAQVRFVTQLNNQQGDAFEVPLPVKPLEISESVVESGTTDSQVRIPVNVTDNVIPDAGGLEISLASTLMPEIIAPAKEVLKAENLPFLEPAASQLAIASNLQILSQKYRQALSEFNPTQQSAIALDQLQKLQQPDGGFASYPGTPESDPMVTPYAAESLASAKAAGFSIDDGMVSRVTSYLKNLLADPGQYEYCNTQACKNRMRLRSLMALAALGEQRNDFLADIYAQREELYLTGKIQLARYLSNFPDWQTEARSLFDEIQETTYQTGRSANLNLPETWDWLSTPTTAQAQTLRLAIAQNAPADTIDRLLQGLLNLRRKGTWQNTYANAEAFAALVAYSNTQPTPPNFTATVQLGSDRLNTTTFNGYQNPSVSLNVAMDRLPPGNNDLILQKTGNGTLHYLVSYRYRLQGNQPGRFNGLRVARDIRAVDADQALQRVEVSIPDKTLSVPAGQVFDIGLEIITDHPVNHLIITDPLPAGFEAVDGSFQTSTPGVQAQSDSWQIGYRTIHGDRVVAYSDRLDPGVYTFHYLVRSVTPGTYLWPGTDVHLQYAPEEFGRSASSTLEVKE